MSYAVQIFYPMEKISKTVKKVIEDLKSKKTSLDYEKVKSSLRKILSPKETKHLYIHSFRKKILRVNVDSVVLLYQLDLKKNLILERLRKDFRFDSVEKIIFCLRSLPIKNKAKSNARGA